MILEKLILNDFLTFKDFEYNFQNKPLQIQGLNLTDIGQKANGTGKSGMQTGIEFCITGTNSRDVRDAELINYNKSSAHLELFAYCGVRKQRLHIMWTINKKGSNQLSLEIEENDKYEDVSFSNINDGKKFIQNWFGISKEDLFNYFIINKTRFKSFFRSSNKQKVDLINRFTDARVIDGIEEIDKSILEEKVSEKEKIVSKHIGAIDYIDSQIQTVKEHDYESDFLIEKENIINKISSLKNKNKLINEEIESIKEDIQECVEEGEIYDSKYSKYFEEKNKLETELEDANKKLEASELKLKQYDELDKLNDKLDKNRKEKRDLISTKEDYRTKISKLNAIKRKLNVILGGSITCPHCHTKWIEDADIDEVNKKIKDIDKGVSNYDDNISLIDEEIEKYNKKEDSIKKDIEKSEQKIEPMKHDIKKNESYVYTIKEKIKDKDKSITEIGKDIFDNERETQDILADKNKLLRQISFNNDLIEDEETKKDSLKKEDGHKEIEQYEKDKKNKNKLLSKSRKELSSAKEELSSLIEWSNIAKQFRMFLANKSLETIQYHMNRFLSQMGGVNLRVEIDGLKFLADGTKKEEITAMVERDGQLRTFSSFSGGERGRLLFASILANQYMINKTHPYGGLQFLSIDEIFEGVDSLGLKFLVDAAKDLNMTVMLISHVSDEETDADTLTIVKENNISKIKE